jgi:hypothetical protein
MEGGLIWIGVVFGILAVSLLAAIISGKRRKRSRVSAGDGPSLAQAAKDFAKLRYQGARGYRRRG